MGKARFSWLLLLVLGLLGVCCCGRMAVAADDAEEDAAATKQFLASLKWQQGTVTIGNNLATLNLPSELRYLNPEQSQQLLTDFWGNPPGDKPLGMLFPAGISPADPECWAVVITYDEDGYIKDGDAEKIDYNELLEQMQQGAKESNAERTKRGYSPIELVGWAEAPRYDKATHKMYWAKEIKFGDSAENTLNYNIRVLGRRGVLVLNVVSAMQQIDLVRQQNPQILAAVDFNPGNRYEDYVPGTDKVASYGLAALVAGGVAAKAGIFKAIWIFILGAKKLIIIGLIALGAGAKKLWGSSRGGSR